MDFSGTSPVAGTTMLLPASTERIQFEQLDCPPLALNLCVRQNRSPSPCPEGAHHDVHSTNPVTPVSSHRTESDSSETGSTISESISYGDFGCVKPKVKPTRPFKAYTKDPLFLSVGLAAAVNSPPLTPDLSLNKDSAEAYADFRQRMLSYVRAANPIPGITNTKMRRNTTQTQPIDGKDASYWEKRRKNNEAAKRSRDARRAKEDEIAIRAAFLEQENLKLKYEVAALRNETAKLRCLLYN